LLKRFVPPLLVEAVSLTQALTEFWRERSFVRYRTGGKTQRLSSRCTTGVAGERERSRTRAHESALLRFVLCKY